MPVAFQEFVEKTNSIDTVERLIEVFQKEILVKFGYDRMAFCLLSDHTNIGLEAGVGYINNYPDDWLNHYFENNFHEFDPVLSYGRQKFGTFSWKEIIERMAMTSKQAECLTLGTEAKLHNGTFTPLWGPQRFSGVSLATTEKIDACNHRPEALDLITAYCNHFYLVFQRLNQSVRLNNEEYENLFLTAIEKEIMTWAAKGKSDNDISSIMNCSSSTINYHFRTIFKKLKCNQRVVAVSKAIALGLINP